MNPQTKNEVIFSGVAIAALGILLGVYLYSTSRTPQELITEPAPVQTQAPAAGGTGFTESVCDLNGGQNATTTTGSTVYVATSSAVASTTLYCYTANASSVDLNLYTNASSSALSSVQWECAYSQGSPSTSTPSGFDWYYSHSPQYIPAASTTNPLVFTTQHQLYKIVPTGGINTMSMTLSSEREKYMRCDFSGLGAATAIYPQLILNQSIQN